jgi:NADH-quinone oxidoreductase subunit E
MNEAIDIGAIADRYHRDPSRLQSILQDIQAKQNWLPRESLLEVSRALDVPLSRVFSIATFFNVFSLTPRGRHKISVCLGTACHVKGGNRILERIERDLDIKEGETTEDSRFTLETVRCIGCCSLAPAIVVDGDTHGRLSQDKLKKTYKEYE